MGLYVRPAFAVHIGMSLESELREYAELDGTEVGEACLLMCKLFNYPDYLTPRFNGALHREMREQLENYKREFVIEEVREQETRMFKVLKTHKTPARSRQSR